MKKSTVILILISLILLLQVFNQRLEISLLQAELLDYQAGYDAGIDENF